MLNPIDFCSYARHDDVTGRAWVAIVFNQPNAGRNLRVDGPT
jgi:hypothetical protein